MDTFESFILARALHILGVVLWIGGVAFVTTVLIPALKKRPDREDSVLLFEKLEGRFAFQAKIVTLITGLSGFVMLEFLDAWGRYLELQFWWLHLMTFIWLVFSIVLFILEPLFLHRWFMEQAAKDSEKALFWLHRMHIILMTLSLIAVLAAVAGSHGYSF